MSHLQHFETLVNAILNEIIGFKEATAFYIDHIPEVIRNDIETKADLLYLKVQLELQQFQSAAEAVNRDYEQKDFQLQQANFLLKIMAVLNENSKKISRLSESNLKADNS